MNALPEPEDDFDRGVLAHIAEYGWHINLIPEDEEGPGFGYTVGLTYSFAHPEVMLFGLPIDVIQDVLNEIGNAVKEGTLFPILQPVSDILEGYNCIFGVVEKAHYPEYLGYCRWLYRGDDFTALQCMWSDKNGRFPWEDGVPSSLQAQQPVLAQISN